MAQQAALGSGWKMRVVVIGTSGSGKSTIAAAIGRRFGIPVIELDALNWRPGWEALSQTDPPAFLRACAAAAAQPGWVIAGNYFMARHIVWSRATHVVWLDYPRHVVMARVIRRSFLRAARREVIWGGNREEFRLWLDRGHPIQWAWRTWQSNRTTIAKRLAEPSAAHLRVLQVIRPGDAAKVPDRLAATPPRAL